jgi:3-oxoacyl-[acyl-carrier protein] reductase
VAAKRALVIGGSRGIGRAIVERLARDGFEVLFTFCSNRAAAEAVGRGRHFQLDLRDRARPGNLVRELEAGGPIDALVCSAGLRRDGLLAMTSDHDWEQVIDADLGGVFRCCRAVLPGMMRRRAGAIVNLSSLTALHGIAGQTAYGAAKAGILGLTRSLAREVGKCSVRVNAVVPGYVATDFTKDLGDDAVRALRAQECLPGGVQVESVAAAVAFLLSAGADSITGQVLVVDAGCSV